jgi:hypothetical protein
MESRGVRVSRTKTSEICVDEPIPSIGASYTHINSLKGIIRKETNRVVMYHAMLESMEGLELADYIEHAFLGFNRIRGFRPEDAQIRVGVLDLAGNPITTLVGAPVCRELIVSSTLITSLEGLPEGIEVIRCGHSTHLKSLKGCPGSVKLIEVSCAENLIIDPADLPKSLEELIRD